MTHDQKEAVIKGLLFAASDKSNRLQQIDAIDRAVDFLRALAASQTAPAWSCLSPDAENDTQPGLVITDDSQPAPAVMQHVAYYDEGQFHWMSGIAARDCELYAAMPFASQPAPFVKTPTNDQIAAVMLMHGTPAQQAEAVAYVSQPAPAADTGQAVAWPDAKINNPDIANPTGQPYIDCLIHRLLDAQQDLNLEANETMSQSLADTSALLDEVETAIRRFATHPAPLDAERVREDERDRLFEKAGHVLLITNVCDPRNIRASNVAAWLSKEGAMSPAERAALRQKEGGA